MLNWHILPLYSQVKHFDVKKKKLKLQSEGKTAESKMRLTGVMGERIDLEPRRQSIGMPFITIL